MDSSAYDSGVGFIKAVEAPGPRPDVVRRLRALFEMHDDLEDQLVQAYRRCHIDEDTLDRLWRDHDSLERLTVRAMAMASPEEVEAAHGG